MECIQSEVILSSHGSLDAIVHCLTTDRNLEAKQNTTATIFSLVAVENYRPVVSDRPEVIKALLDLIRLGSPKCKKDSLKALFHLALVPINRPKLVSAGVVPVLFSLLMNSGLGIIEDATALIALVVGCSESREAFKRIFGIEVLVDLDFTSVASQQRICLSYLPDLPAEVPMLTIHINWVAELKR